MWYNIGVSNIVEWTPMNPYIPNSPKKQSFMSFRIAGHEVQESIVLTGISERTFYHWKQTDANFEYWNGPALDELRKKQRDKLVGDSFIINANLVQQLDRVFLTRIHIKKNNNIALTEEEKNTLNKLRTIYASPTQMKAVRELVETGTTKVVSITNWFDRVPPSSGIIEGEFTEVADEVPHLQPASGTPN